MGINPMFEGVTSEGIKGQRGDFGVLVVLQCCVIFRCMQGDSDTYTHTHTHTHTHIIFPIRYYKTLSIVLCAM